MKFSTKYTSVIIDAPYSSSRQQIEQLEDDKRFNNGIVFIALQLRCNLVLRNNQRFPRSYSNIDMPIATSFHKLITKTELYKIIENRRN